MKKHSSLKKCISIITAIIFISAIGTAYAASTLDYSEKLPMVTESASLNCSTCGSELYWYGPVLYSETCFGYYGYQIYVSKSPVLDKTVSELEEMNVNNCGRYIRYCPNCNLDDSGKWKTYEDKSGNILLTDYKGLFQAGPHYLRTVYRFVDEDYHQVISKCDSQYPNMYISSRRYGCGLILSKETKEHFDDNDDGLCDGCGYLMTRFSVTVPTSISFTMDDNGNVSFPDDIKILNNSTDEISVDNISFKSENGWTIVPYSTNMACEKVDSKKIGISINEAETKNTGTSEELDLSKGEWNIPKNDEKELQFDAVVSASSDAVTNEKVLTMVITTDWPES